MQGAIKEKQVVAEVIDSEVSQLLGGKSAAQYNEAFLEQHGGESLLHRAAAAEMMAFLDPQSKPKAVQVILKRGGLVGNSSNLCYPCWHARRMSNLKPAVVWVLKGFELFARETMATLGLPVQSDTDSNHQQLKGGTATIKSRHILDATAT